jgi:hypothetical protein
LQHPGRFRAAAQRLCHFGAGQAGQTKLDDGSLIDRKGFDGQFEIAAGVGLDRRVFGRRFDRAQAERLVEREVRMTGAEAVDDDVVGDGEEPATKVVGFAGMKAG